MGQYHTANFTCPIKMITQKQEIDEYLARLFPITRSITGNGNRQTLNILSEIIPLQIHEYNTGTRVYDWEIPNEWNIKDAWIKNPKGEKVVDFKQCNLHVVGYSTAIHAKMKLAELKNNLHYFTQQPDVIPYRTSYYTKTWGFCVSYNSYLNNFSEDEEYEVYIDAELKPGSLTLADYVLKGTSATEYLLSTYICHPSMANDNLSGVIVAAFLARELSNRQLKNSYRFVFAPETIGTITYCATHEDEMKKISGGLVFSCMGGRGPFGYKQTFEGNSIIDKVVAETFEESKLQYITYPFIPQGSDERQYSSPGFRIPIGSVHKDKYHEFSYYHTSADNLSFIQSEHLLTMVQLHLSIIDKLEKEVKFISLNPHCEPQLGKRGLYPAIGRRTIANEATNADNGYKDELDIILWILFYADGKYSLQDVCQKHNFQYEQVAEIANRLESKGLIKFL